MQVWVQGRPLDGEAFVARLKGGLGMCGRIYIKATLEEMLQNFAFADRGDVGSLQQPVPEV